jgi:hypothetical protein
VSTAFQQAKTKSPKKAVPSPVKSPSAVLKEETVAKHAAVKREAILLRRRESRVSSVDILLLFRVTS